MKLLGFVFAIILSSLALHANAQSSPQKAQDVVKHLEVLKSCDLSRIWPGYTWEKKFDSVLFVSTDESRSFEFDNHSSALKEIPFEETPSFALGGFAFNSTEKKKTLSYNLDLGENFHETFLLIVHENFHYFGQDKIVMMPVNGRTTRADAYPLNPIPRMYRAMVNFYLAETLKRPEQKNESLAKAKFWNELHKSDYFDDYISTGNLDMVEGSAMYAEILSLTMAQNNCDVSNDTVLKLFFHGPNHIYNFYDTKMSDKGGQSYLGGMLAYMIDDLLYQGKHGLKAKAAQSIHPIEELLSSLLPVEAPIQEEISTSIEQEFSTLNSLSKADIDLFNENKQKGMILISQPAQLEGDDGGSYSLNGFVAVDEEVYGFAEILQMYERSFETPFVKAKFNGVNLYETTQNECGENQFMYWVNETSIENNTLQAKSDVIDIAASRFEAKKTMICIR